MRTPTGDGQGPPAEGLAVERPGPPQGGLAGRAIGGIRWTSASLALRAFFQVIVGIVLARLLVPTDFGLLALAYVFTQLVNLLRDFGLTSALVRLPTVTERTLSTAFWLNLAMGVAWGSVLAALAWPGAWFFDEPRLRLLLLLLSANVVLGSFGGVRRAVMGRQMRFAESARVEVHATWIGGAVAVAMAFAGAGVWSLVGQAFATTIAANLLGWPLVQHRPGLRFSRADAKELLSFGFHSTNTNLLSYLYRYLDNILIGRFFGAAALGFYDFAYRAFRQPMQNSRQVLGKVMFPTLASLQHDDGAFRQMYLRSSRYLSALLVGGFAMLHIAAEDYVLGIYGTQWEDSVPLLRILTVAGLAQALLLPTGWIYQAKGEMGLAFRNSVTWGLLPAVAAFLIGIRWGVEGVAWAVVATSAFVLYPGFRVPLRLIGLRVRDIGGGLALLVLSGVFAGSIGYLAAYALRSLPHLAALPLEVAATGVAYAAGLWLLDQALVRDLWRLGLGFLGRKGGKGAAGSGEAWKVAQAAAELPPPSQPGMPPRVPTDDGSGPPPPPTP